MTKANFKTVEQNDDQRAGKFVN